MTKEECNKKKRKTIDSSPLMYVNYAYIFYCLVTAINTSRKWKIKLYKELSYKQRNVDITFQAKNWSE